MDKLPDEIVGVINEFLDHNDHLRETSKQFSRLPLTGRWYRYNPKAKIEYPILYRNTYHSYYDVHRVICDIHDGIVSCIVIFEDLENERQLEFYETLGKTTSIMKIVGFDEVNCQDSAVKKLCVSNCPNI